MADVTIFAEHRDILDALITSRKVKSIAGATKTGPFKDQRDAYVFAASIAIACDKPTPSDKMPAKKKGATSIRDSVFLGAAGAKELALAVALINDSDAKTIEESLAQQLDQISDERVFERFELLDQYAHAGFTWLAKYQDDESTIRDLILTALDQIECVEGEVSDSTDVHDPLLDMLDVQL